MSATTLDAPAWRSRDHRERRARLWADAPSAERELRLVLAELQLGHRARPREVEAQAADYADRPLLVTNVAVGYNPGWAFAIAIQGSPHQGLLHVDLHELRAYYLRGSRSSCVSAFLGGQARRGRWRVIERFLRAAGHVVRSHSPGPGAPEAE